jgi:excisionase family DNA binding protein
MPVTKNTRAFTTFEVAKFCGVFHTTVINWVNKGKLKAHFTPGGHRRILPADLLDFMQRFDMPIPPDLTERKKRVLIVEDDAVVQNSLVRALKPLQGIEVQACGNGVEALMAIGRDTPELLVLDIRIPGVNGLDVCRVLHSSEQTAQIKIIAVSGEALLASEEAFLREHAQTFVRKPVPLSEFRSAVAALLELEVAK